MFTHPGRMRDHSHFLAASSKFPTSCGTSSSSSSAALPSFPRDPSWVFKNWYCCGPTCLRISGIISLSSLVSGVPATTKRFSLTENWANTLKKIESECFLKLTLRFLQVNNGVVIFEHVDFINILELLHT